MTLSAEIFCSYGRSVCKLHNLFEYIKMEGLLLRPSKEYVYIFIFLEHNLKLRNYVE
jgi:hypothetical protein